MKRIEIALVGLMVAVMTVSAFGQTAEIKKIDTLVKTIDRGLKKAPQLVFADVSDYTSNDPEKWKKFASEAALEKYRETTAEAYTIAYCWRKRGKFAKSNFTFFSPSGDWAKYVYQYFRPDGTLAKAEIDYRTFEGDMILLQDVYFDQKGRKIKTTTKYLDLRSRKPKKISKEFREEAAQMQKETDYYKTVSKLPFAKLLK